MKNSEVIKAFIEGKNAIGSNLISVDGKLINYTTVIASKEDNIIYLSNKHYSQTTSIHQNRIKQLMGEYQALILKEVEHDVLNK